MAGETKTPEQLQVQLDEALAKVDQLTGQVRGLAAERDQYRASAGGGDRREDGGGAGGASSHVLGRVLGIEGDFREVDEYYVPRAQYTRDLQAAVNNAYAMAKGDMLVMRAIDKATASYGELAKFDSPLSKKALDILQKEGYASARKDGYGQVVPPQSWEDLVYENVNALPRAARMASAELVLEAQAQEKAAAENKATEGAAGMASGGAPVGAGAAPSEEAFVKAAERGDLGGMREVLTQHLESVTGKVA